MQKGCAKARFLPCLGHGLGQLQILQNRVISRKLLETKSEEKPSDFLRNQTVLWLRGLDLNQRPPGYEAVSSTNRSHFGSDLCFLPPFARRIFHCFRPALPAFFGFWVKTGSDTILQENRGSSQVQYHLPIMYSERELAILVGFEFGAVA